MESSLHVEGVDVGVDGSEGEMFELGEGGEGGDAGDGRVGRRLEGGGRRKEGSKLVV